MNELNIQVYSSGTTLLNDPTFELTRAEGLTFNTGFPGGLYLDCSFYIPRNILKAWEIKGGQRVVVRNGMRIVYEGWISNIEYSMDSEEQGCRVTALGGWGTFLMNRRFRKRWADSRFTDDPWKWQTDLTVVSAPDKCQVDRYSRIQFTPKDGVAWTSGEFVAVHYTMPVGQTVSRVVYTYELQESTQQWELALYRSADNSTWTVVSEANGDTIAGAATTTSITASSATAGTAMDAEIATPVRYIKFAFIARANQTGVEDGSIFARVTNLSVRSATGDVDLATVAQYIVTTMNTELNDDNSNIAAITTDDIVPLIFDDYESAADILDETAKFGDSSFNRWGVQLLDSEKADVPDGKPVLKTMQFPALTDYEYVVSLSEIEPAVTISKDYDSIVNWVVVEYDDDDGVTQYVTPDDDANLKDTGSISDYGQRDHVIGCGHVTSAIAIQSGRRFLAARKDPQWRLSGPLTVRHIIRGKSGNIIPVSMIQAGDRVRIEDFIENLSGTGLTFIISGTQYDDESRTCAISTGMPDSFILPRPLPRIQKPPERTASESSGGDNRRDQNRGNAIRKARDEAWYKKHGRDSVPPWRKAAEKKRRKLRGQD